MCKNISIEEMKDLQINILKNIDKFCNSNNIRYTLMFGSLLGAVRHQGYIPWDDDVDIAMLRPDYERFIKSYNKNQVIYHVYDYRYDDEYTHPYAKIADTRTVLVECVNEKSIGINIDLFPIDYVSNSIEESKKLIHRLDLIKKIYRIKLIKPGIKNVWWKRIVIRIAKIMMLTFTMKKLTEKECNLFFRCKRDDADFVAIAVDPEINASCRGICPKSFFENYIDVKFGSYEFKAIAEYDKWLIQMYGDYMTPPAIGQRTSPHTLNKVYWL